MSNETNTGTPAPEAPVTQFSETGIAYEVIPFRAKSEAEGFLFTTKLYRDSKAITDDIGEEALVNLVNAEVQARLGMKARNTSGFSSLGEVEASKYPQVKGNLVQTLLAKYPSKVIFSQEDALSWKPDVRELSLSGIQKKVSEAFKAGDMAGVQLWIQQLQAVVARQQERAAAGLV